MHQNSHAKDEKTEDDVCKDGEIYMYSFSSSFIEIEWGAGAKDILESPSSRKGRKERKNLEFLTQLSRYSIPRFHRKLKRNPL